MKFPKLVIEEATALKKHATEQELDMLSFEGLNPEDSRYCIYGQMTGSCWSERAVELINLCASRVYDDVEPTEDGVFSGAKLNGSPIEKDRLTYWSPIEVFISRNSFKDNDNLNKKLIRFLKGEIKTL